MTDRICNQESVNDFIDFMTKAVNDDSLRWHYFKSWLPYECQGSQKDYDHARQYFAEHLKGSFHWRSDS